jgi:peptide/nickel transport system substrate-binding protein
MQVLNSAGFKKGPDGIYTDPSGKKLSFNLNVVSGWSDWVTDCQIVASELKSIGIQANVNAISYSSFFNALQTGTFDTSLYTINGGPTPFYIFQTVLSKDRSAPVGQLAVSNFERWIDPTTQNLLVQYASTTDRATQQQALNSLQEIMVNQIPVIPMVYGAFWFEYNTQNFTGWPDQSNPYAVGAPWQFPDAAVVLLHLKPVA